MSKSKDRTFMQNLLLNPNRSNIPDILYSFTMESFCQEHRILLSQHNHFLPELFEQSYKTIADHFCLISYMNRNLNISIKKRFRSKILENGHLDRIDINSSSNTDHLLYFQYEEQSTGNGQRTYHGLFLKNIPDLPQKDQTTLQKLNQKFQQYVNNSFPFKHNSCNIQEFQTIRKRFINSGFYASQLYEQNLKDQTLISLLHAMISKNQITEKNYNHVKIVISPHRNFSKKISQKQIEILIQQNYSHQSMAISSLVHFDEIKGEPGFTIRWMRKLQLQKNTIQYPYLEPENQIDVNRGEEKKALCLALQGGGAKGISYLGALEALIENTDYDLERNLDSVIGSSIGAIIGLGFVCGISEQTFKQICIENFSTMIENDSCLQSDNKEFGKFDWKQKIMALAQQLQNRGFIPTSVKNGINVVVQIYLESQGTDAIKNKLPYARQLLMREGKIDLISLFKGRLMTGNSILNANAQMVIELLKKQFPKTIQSINEKQLIEWVKTEMTMQKLYTLTGIEFTVTSVDLDDNKLRFFNHKTTPKLPVCEAVKMSGSFPTAFKLRSWQKQWDTYQISYEYIRREVILDGHEFSDGGILSNFPIQYLDNDKLRKRYLSHCQQITHKKKRIILGLELESNPQPIVIADDGKKSIIAAFFQRLKNIGKVPIELGKVSIELGKELVTKNEKGSLQLLQEPVFKILMKLVRTYIYSRDHLSKQVFIDDALKLDLRGKEIELDGFDIVASFKKYVQEGIRQMQEQRSEQCLDPQIKQNPQINLDPQLKLDMQIFRFISQLVSEFIPDYLQFFSYNQKYKINSLTLISSQFQKERNQQEQVFQRAQKMMDKMKKQTDQTVRHEFNRRETRKILYMTKDTLFKAKNLTNHAEIIVRNTEQLLKRVKISYSSVLTNEILSEVTEIFYDIIFSILEELNLFESHPLAPTLDQIDKKLEKFNTPLIFYSSDLKEDYETLIQCLNLFKEFCLQEKSQDLLSNVFKKQMFRSQKTYSRFYMMYQNCGQKQQDKEKYFPMLQKVNILHEIYQCFFIIPLEKREQIKDIFSNSFNTFLKNSLDKAGHKKKIHKYFIERSQEKIREFQKIKEKNHETTNQTLNMHLVLETHENGMIYSHQFIKDAKKFMVKQNKLTLANKVANYCTQISCITGSNVNAFVMFLNVLDLPENKIQAYINKMRKILKKSVKIDQNFDDYQWIKTKQASIYEFKRDLWKDQEKKIKEILEEPQYDDKLKKYFSEFQEKTKEMLDDMVICIEELNEKKITADEFKERLSIFDQNAVKKRFFDNKTQKIDENIRDVYQNFFEILKSTIIQILPHLPSLNSKIVNIDYRSRSKLWANILMCRVIDKYEIRKLIGSILSSQLGVSTQITLKELHQIGNGILLNFTVIDSEENVLRFLNAYSTPFMPLVECLISCISIPFYSLPTYIKKQWFLRSEGPYANNKLNYLFNKTKNTGYKLITGDQLTTFPLHLLTNQKIRKELCFFKKEKEVFYALEYEKKDKLFNKKVKPIDLRKEQKKQLQRREQQVKQLKNEGQQKSWFGARIWRYFFSEKSIQEQKKEYKFDNVLLLLKNLDRDQMFKKGRLSAFPFADTLQNLSSIYMGCYDNTVIKLYKQESIKLPTRLDTLDFISLFENKQISTLGNDILLQSKCLMNEKLINSQKNYFNKETQVKTKYLYIKLENKISCFLEKAGQEKEKQTAIKQFDKNSIYLRFLSSENGAKSLQESQILYFTSSNQLGKSQFFNSDLIKVTKQFYQVKFQEQNDRNIYLVIIYPKIVYGDGEQIIQACVGETRYKIAIPDLQRGEEAYYRIPYANYKSYNQEAIKEIEVENQRPEVSLKLTKIQSRQAWLSQKKYICPNCFKNTGDTAMRVQEDFNKKYQCQICRCKQHTNQWYRCRNDCSDQINFCSECVYSGLKNQNKIVECSNKHTNLIHDSPEHSPLKKGCGFCKKQLGISAEDLIQVFATTMKKDKEDIIEKYIDLRTEKIEENQ